jgi:hypothetical protein
LIVIHDLLELLRRLLIEIRTDISLTKIQSELKPGFVLIAAADEAVREEIHLETEL